MDTIQNLRPTPTKPMTQEEFNKKWGDIRLCDIWESIKSKQLTEKHYEVFLNDLYNLYETTGFTERYEMPLLYSDAELKHFGMKYDIIRRGTKEEVDDQEMPVYLVKFENGDENLVEANEIALVLEDTRDIWYRQFQHEIAGVPFSPEKPAKDPDHVSFQQLYNSAVEQNDLLRKLLAEKDKEIASLRKALKPDSE